MKKRYCKLQNSNKIYLIEKITDHKGNILYEYKYKNEYLLNERKEE